MKRIFTFLKDLCSNIFLNKKYDLFYIIENANWVTDWEGKNITYVLNQSNLIRCKISSTHLGLRDKIIHFGSVDTFIAKNGLKNVHPSNKIILTWFHIVPDDERAKFIPQLNSKTHIIHTASRITRNKLIQFGAQASKVIIIPLGVDTSRFHPISQEEKNVLRKDLRIKKDSIVIGSFQKDGNGWGKGLTPKFVKGPDIFCKVMGVIARTHPLHIILTGPSRGYVKKNLNQLNIPYSHIYVKNPEEVARYYQALDLYVICSREEGGPKALLETMASGIPLVSTRVGMAPDVIQDGVNGFLVDVEDIQGLVQKSLKVSGDQMLSKNMVKKALETMRQYSSLELAKRFYYEIYKDLIK